MGAIDSLIVRGNSDVWNIQASGVLSALRNLFTCLVIECVDGAQ